MRHKSNPRLQIYFSDFFQVDPQKIEEYGALNISLINDLPLFIDPFLLFNSSKPEYQSLHTEIIAYLRFLRDMSRSPGIKQELIHSWFRFSEVKQTWLGYSEIGNSGRGLGKDFANALNQNLYQLFSNFGNEEITRSSHLEKLCLIKGGVGKDSISDFTTNLIKRFLLEYTQAFALEFINPELLRDVPIPKVRFNYDTRSWVTVSYTLPFYDNDYILLTPKDILTREDTWINRRDLTDPNIYSNIVYSLPNSQLRAHMDEYFKRALSGLEGEKRTDKEIREIIASLIQKYPEFIDYYIKYKEENGESAVSISEERVKYVETVFIQQLTPFVEQLFNTTKFYNAYTNTYHETMARIEYLKDVIENKGGHRIFYADHKPIRREQDLQTMFRLVWFATTSDVSQEVNDGRGPVDFKISRGAADKTLAEFKLASNTKLKNNLQHQTPIYQAASDAQRAIKVIIYFTEQEQRRVRNTLQELDLLENPDIVLIDARRDNKPSGSMATDYSNVKA